MAADARKRSSDSFDRCDTDGFLSQWASDVMARRYDWCAKVAGNGGRLEISAIFDLNGKLLSFDYREGQYGSYYLVKSPDWTGRPFVTTSGARKFRTRAANNAKKGVTEGTVSVPAYLDGRTGEPKPDLVAARAGDVLVVSVDAHQSVDH